MKLPAKLVPCVKLLDCVNVRLEQARARFKELADSRTSDEPVRDQFMEALERWFVLGREEPKPAPIAEGGGPEEASA